MNREPLYIGLMSGTSMDALDAVLVGFGTGSVAQTRILAHHSLKLPLSLRDDLLKLNSPDSHELTNYAILDRQFGILSAQAVTELCAHAGVPATEISAIGSHGQTVRHAPDHSPAYSLQLGDPNTIAERTGITTVADFRRRDIAAGGQGAPLVPAFHAAAFRCSHAHRLIINIGGMSNISVLPAEQAQPVRGWDTGPGNVLMDYWHQTQQGGDFDQDGRWAQSGALDAELLGRLLSDPFFQRSPPKSTGRQHFDRHWLNAHLQGIVTTSAKAASVQRTLLELTAKSIANDALHAMTFLGDHTKATEVFLCGGGARNKALCERIRHLLGNHYVGTTEALGVDPQLVEATAFAWLARQALQGLAGNLPEVTGATGSRILGGIYQA